MNGWVKEAWSRVKGFREQLQRRGNQDGVESGEGGGDGWGREEERWGGKADNCTWTTITFLKKRKRGVGRKVWDSSIVASWSWQAFRKFSVWAETAQRGSRDIVLFLILLEPFHTVSFGVFHLTRIPSLTFLRPSRFLPPAPLSSPPPLPLESVFPKLSPPYPHLHLLLLGLFFFGGGAGDLIYSQIFHLYSVSPKSIFLTLTSQTPSLNLYSLGLFSSLLFKLDCLNPNTLPFHQLFLPPDFLELSSCTDILPVF